MTRFALSFLAAAVLFGQSGRVIQGGATGVITGVITDQSGAVVPRVKVQAINLHTDGVWVGETSRTGVFVVSVPPGKYNIVVEQPGFKKVTRSALQVDGNTSLPVDIRLMLNDTPRLIHPLSVPKVLTSDEN
jgi:hypothetical protein